MTGAGAAHRATKDQNLRTARLDWLLEPGNRALLGGGLRGVEKESLRVTADGRLSKSPHPAALGSALTHPYLTTDYSEALLEFVTPPRATNAETLEFLRDLHVYTLRRIGDERLWPSSMPCIVNANQEIPIARYGSSNPGMMKTVYRRGLGYRYGRAMQAIAGVHFNYSPPLALWEAYRDAAGRRDEPLDRFRSERMMGLARNYRRLSWLVIYLFGASPALCKSFLPGGHELLEELDPGTWYAPYATSLRMSDIGYRNKTQARLSISLNSLDEYVAGLVAAVTTVEPRYAEIGVEVDGEYRQLNANILQIENEYYTQIRPKPRKGTSDRPTVALRRGGVEYVEIRTLDLCPTDPIGIDRHTLPFVELLLLYCLLAESPPIDADEQREIDARDLAVAREGRRRKLALPSGGTTRELGSWGLEVVDRLGDIAELLEGHTPGYVEALARQREALEDPDATPSARLLAAMRERGVSFAEYARGLASAHRDALLATPLSAAREAELDALAASSLAEQARLEQDDTPFAEYLARYFSEV
nr:glutamate--cysteine ligase [Gammaproteobacteria bacterium]